MFYVAKLHKFLTPIIVEAFETYEDAFTYAELMSRNKQTTYIILTSVTTIDAVIE